ncbi:hypothetical protein [Methylobacterium sp. NEAU K]|nr:hypothetical protein [Methylobacterium sp. NEAU K]MDP4006256.1 hypothetical protein [Methylobacterium sp. NEAU K]
MPRHLEERFGGAAITEAHQGMCGARHIGRRRIREQSGRHIIRGR